MNSMTVSTFRSLKNQAVYVPCQSPFERAENPSIVENTNFQIRKSDLEQDFAVNSNSAQNQPGERLDYYV